MADLTLCLSVFKKILSIRVAEFSVIRVGLSIVGKKEWERKLFKNVEIWACSEYLRRSRLYSPPIDTI